MTINISATSPRGVSAGRTSDATPSTPPLVSTAVPIVADSFAVTPTAVVAELTQASVLSNNPAVQAALVNYKTTFENLLKSSTVPGGSWAFFTKDGLVGAGQAGVAKEGGNEVDAKTMFRIGSVSKLFTQIAIAKLAKEGKLSLDDKVTDHLSWFTAEPKNWASKITIRQLLTHTSGLQREVGGGLDTWSNPGKVALEPQDFIKASKTWEIHAEPGGTNPMYSNLGLALAGQIVEKVSQQPFKDYVTEQIFKPLGMTSTKFIDDLTPSDPMATGYLMPPAPGQQREEANPIEKAGALASVAGVISTPADLAKFAGWLTSAKENDPLLPRSWLDEGTTMGNTSSSMGDFGGIALTPSGAMVFEADNVGQMIGHTGTFHGFRAGFAVMPNGLGFTFLSNTGDLNAVKLLQNAANAVLPSMVAALPKSNTPPTEPTNPDWKRMIGKFNLREFLTTIGTDAKGNLTKDGFTLKQIGGRKSHSDGSYSYTFQIPVNEGRGPSFAGGALEEIVLTVPANQNDKVKYTNKSGGLSGQMY